MTSYVLIDIEFNVCSQTKKGYCDIGQSLTVFKIPNILNRKGIIVKNLSNSESKEPNIKFNKN